MLLLGFLLAGLLPGPPVADPAPALMPVPASVTWRVGKLRLDSSFTVHLAGPVRGARLARGVARFVRRAGGMTGLILDRGVAGLTVAVQRPGERVQSPAEDESYTLEVTSGGATLEAPTTVGALHGLETVLQLIA